MNGGESEKWGNAKLLSSIFILRKQAIGRRRAKGNGYLDTCHPLEDRRRTFINRMREILGSTAIVRLVSRSDQSNQALEKHVARSEPIVGPTVARSIWTYCEASQARLVLSTAYEYSPETIRIEHLFSELYHRLTIERPMSIKGNISFEWRISPRNSFLAKTIRVEQ